MNTIMLLLVLFSGITTFFVMLMFFYIFNLFQKTANMMEFLREVLRR